MKKRVISLLFAVALLCSALSIPAEATGAGETVRYGRYAQSRDNLSNFVTDGKYFYYIGDSNNNATIARQPVGGGETVLLLNRDYSEFGRLAQLNLMDGWLYFLSGYNTANTEQEIYRIRTDGTGLSLLYSAPAYTTEYGIQSYRQIMDVLVANDQIYATVMISNSQLVSMNLDGSNPQVLGNGSAALAYGNHIFMGSSRYNVVSKTFENQTLEGIPSGARLRSISPDGRLYFVKPPSDMPAIPGASWSCTLNGTDLRDEKFFMEYIIVDDNVYYSSDGSIYKEALNASGSPVKIADGRFLNYHNGYFCTWTREDTTRRFYLVGTPSASETQPTQSTPSNWAAEYVKRANSLNLVPDALNSAYTQAITRAEYCALAVTLYEAVTGNAITERKTFTDTKDKNVEKAAAIGVVAGINAEGTLFSPDTALTREQAAVMLSRLAEAIGKPLPEQAATFADNNSIASWAVIQVGQVQAAGIMSGIGNNQFSPQGNYTREQSIITIIRLYDIVK